MSLAPGACAGISAESEAGSPLGGPSAPKRGTSQTDWQFTTPPARRVKSEIQSAGYARRRRLLRDCGRGFNSRRLHLQRSRSVERLLGVEARVDAAPDRDASAPTATSVRAECLSPAAWHGSPASPPWPRWSCSPSRAERPP